MRFEIDVNYVHAHTCCPKVNRTCSRSNPNFPMCRAYHRSVYSPGNGVFANRFCARCNGIENIENTVYGTGAGNFYFSVLIKFYDIDKDGQPMCKEDEIFDTSTLSCVIASCQSGWSYVNKECIKTGSYKKVEKNQCKLRIKGNISDSVQCITIYAKIDKNASTDEVFNVTSYSQMLSNCTLLQTEAERLLMCRVSMNEVERISVMITELSSSRILWSVLNTMYILYSDIPQITDFYGLDFSRYLSNGSICLERTYRQVVKNNNSSGSNSNTLNWAQVTRKRTTYYVGTCQAVHNLHCPMKVYPSDLIFRIPNTNRIYIRGTSIELDPWQFVPFQHGIGVCVKDTFAWMKLVNEIEVHLYYIITSMSLIGNLVTTISILLDASLHNVSNLSVSALSISLLISDIFSITSTALNVEGMICYISAVCLHWALIHCQGWLAVIAFEISSQFSNVIPIRNIRCFKKMKKYAAISASYATLIVGISVAFDQTSNSVVYGRLMNVCWIQDQTARIVLYIIPQVSVTLIAIANVGYILYKVRQRAVENAAILQEQTRRINFQCMATKLAVLFGIVEIVSCIQIANPSTERQSAVNAAFAVLYTFVRSSRGVLLCLFYFRFKKYKCFKCSEGDRSNAS